jgi:DNA-binding NarL/FixJ family response regulator
LTSVKPIELLCFEEDHLLGDSMFALFGREADIHFLGTVERIADLERVIQETHPEVLLLDVNVSESSEVLSKIARHFPNVRLLILSDDGDWKRIDLAVDAGAMGYLVKLCSSRSSMLDAVRRVASGEFYLGECILQRCDRQAPARAA